jgi:transposase InsO family protein
MSRKGDVWDNAAMESFVSSLKLERVSCGAQIPDHATAGASEYS